MREADTQRVQSAIPAPCSVLSVEKAAASILKNCPDGAVFLAAVSGGADSMAMLAALSAVIPAGTVSRESLFCLHVEHGLRPADESCGDAEYVRDYCKKNDIQCRIVSIPQGKINVFAQRRGIGIEAAARHFRHKALVRYAAQLGNNTRILIAHTKDDALELSLMRILRGAGPAGLAAMPQSRGRILRPLINVSRADVIQYLTENKIPWREDSTNKDEKFLRNKIRRKFIPLLNEAFPSWESGVAAMAETQSLIAGFIAEEAGQRVKWVNNLSASISTDAGNFFAQPEIIREEALFQGINALSSLGAAGVSMLACNSREKSIRRAVVRKFCAGFVKTADLGFVRAVHEKGMILLSFAQKDFFESGFSLLIKEPVS